MAEPYQASRHRPHRVRKGLWGGTLGFTAGNGGCWQRNKGFAFGVFPGSDKGPCCERSLQSLERKRRERKKSSLVPVFPPALEVPRYPSSSIAALSPRTTPLHWEGLKEIQMRATKRARHTRSDAAREPWARTLGRAAPPRLGLHLPGRGCAPAARCPAARRPAHRCLWDRGRAGPGAERGPGRQLRRSGGAARGRGAGAGPALTHRRRDAASAATAASAAAPGPLRPRARVTWAVLPSRRAARATANQRPLHRPRLAP